MTSTATATGATISIGLKVYVTDEKELIMEPSLKWAGNPDVTLASIAFGLKATIQMIVGAAIDSSKRSPLEVRGAPKNGRSIGGNHARLQVFHGHWSRLGDSVNPDDNL